MDSPEREPNPPLSNLQESPFFKYLCSLSPIKTTKCVHIPQTYSEMTFPPPPTVFISPPAGTHKRLSLLKSCCMLTSESKDSASEMPVSSAINIESGSLENSWLDQNKGHPSGSPHEVEYEICFVTDYCRRIMKTCNASEESCICPTCRRRSNCCDEDHVDQVLFEPFKEDLPGLNSEVDEKQPHVADSLRGESISTSIQPVEVSTAKNLVIEYKLLQGSCFESCDGAREVVSEKNKAKISTEDELLLLDGLTFSNEKHIVNSVKKHMPIPVSGISKVPMSRDDNFHVLEDLVFQELVGLIQGQSAATLPDDHTTQSLQISSEVHTSGLHDHEDFDSPKKVYTDFDVHESAGCLERDLPHHALDFEGERLSSRTGTSITEHDIRSRGFRRRCLDFEVSEARRKSFEVKVPNRNHDTGNTFERTSFVNSNSQRTSISSSFPCDRVAEASGATNHGASNAEHILSHLSLVGDCHSGKVVANTEQITPSRINENLLVASKGNVAGQSPPSTSSSHGFIHVPSGVGLHLNNLHTNIRTLMVSKSPVSGYSHAPLAKEIISGSHEACMYSAGQDTSFSVGSFGNTNPRLVVSFVEKTKINQQAAITSSNSYIGVLSASLCSHSVRVEGPQAEDVGIQGNASSFENSMLHQEPSYHDVSEAAEGMSQSPHSPRKRGSKDKVGEGCKRCKCKKSRCLKLYCECFAAGVYCVDSCTCHECFNKPEYEETVLGTRQQIESRNPLAFAPKILRTAEVSPTKGEDLTNTPASGRHKRGCNCKKSLCLKKYCECYQAGVGCSEGCRCEGCKNVYGRKGGMEDTEEKELHFDPGHKDFGLERLDVMKQENIAAHKMDQRCSKDLSPITPSVELGWQEECMANSRHEKKRISDEIASNQPCKFSKLLMPPCNLSNMLQAEADDGNANNGSVGSPVFKMITASMHELSPRWDGLDDICTLTPLPYRPSRPLPTSNEHQHSLQSWRSLAFRTGGTSDAASCSPLQPVSTSSSSPLLISTLCNTTDKSMTDEGGSDGNCFVMAGEDLVEDCTFNTGDAAADIPFTTRTTRSSPKQKRVTPPHSAASRNRLGTSKPSPGLRKFILQALPPDKQQTCSWGLVSTGPDET